MQIEINEFNWEELEVEANERIIHEERILFPGVEPNQDSPSVETLKLGLEYAQQAYESGKGAQIWKFFPPNMCLLVFIQILDEFVAVSEVFAKKHTFDKFWGKLSQWAQFFPQRNDFYIHIS